MKLINTYLKSEPFVSKVTTLSANKSSSIVLQITFVLLAILLPALMHISGMPVRKFLPMHYPALFAGLLFGWRSGLVVGLMSPLSSFILTGHPLFVKLIPMTFEIGTYGLISGLFSQKLKLNKFISILSALLIGRVVFILTILYTSGFAAEGPFLVYLQAAMLPGLFGGTLQLLIIPVTSLFIMKFFNLADEVSSSNHHINEKGIND